MSWLLAGAVCATAAGSYITLALLAETEPYENEDGEEEYTLAGYLLLGGAYAAKWFIRKLFGHPKQKVIKNYDNVIMFNPMPEDDDDDENNELVV